MKVSGQGYQPLFATEALAKTASTTGGADGKATEHIFNGVSYWMPNGVVYDHGTHAGYIDELSGSSGSRSTAIRGKAAAARAPGSNPFPSFSLEVVDSVEHMSGARAGAFVLCNC